MAKYYIKLPSITELYGLEKVCIANKKNKILVDPKCKCSNSIPVDLKGDNQQAFETRRHEEKILKDKIEKEKKVIREEEIKERKEEGLFF
ncbi:MAG: hypothetical protein ABSF14_23815 [Terriglobia bacterium]|jgi:hypothetical protein